MPAPPSEPADKAKKEVSVPLEAGASDKKESTTAAPDAEKPTSGPAESKPRVESGDEEAISFDEVRRCPAQYLPLGMS